MSVLSRLNLEINWEGFLSPGKKQTVLNDDVSILIKWGSVKQGLTEAVLQLSQQLNDSSSKAVAQCQ